MSPVFPLVAIVVAWLFAGTLAGQWMTRRRHHALAWAIALGLFGVGHLAVLVGLSAGWSPAVFGVYWLSGALLNVPFLAIGQLHLQAPRQALLWWTLAGLAVAWSVLFTVTATFDTAALAAVDGVPAGREIIPGTVAFALLRPMTFTFVIVVVGSAWSAFRTRRWALLLIAFGTAVAAAGSSVIDSSVEFLFPVLSAAGVALMYVGFRTVTAPAPQPQPSQPVTA